MTLIACSRSPAVRSMMIKVEKIVDKYEYEMSVELVLPQSRTPAVEKNEYQMSGELVLPQSRTSAVEKREY